MHANTGVSLFFFPRWTPLCLFLTNLSRRHWLLAPLPTSLRTSGRRNWLASKVKLRAKKTNKRTKKTEECLRFGSLYVCLFVSWLQRLPQRSAWSRMAYRSLSACPPAVLPTVTLPRCCPSALACLATVPTCQTKEGRRTFAEVSVSK